MLAGKLQGVVAANHRARVPRTQPIAEVLTVGKSEQIRVPSQVARASERGEAIG